MDYFRVGGAFMAIMLIATALPCSWAQAPQAEGNGSTGGPAPVVSADFYSKGSGQSEPVSPQSLMKRSSDLKPVASPNGAVNAAQGTQAAEGQQPPASQAASEPAAAESVATQTTVAAAENAANASDNVAAAQESQAALQAAAAATATPATQEVITPEEIPQENSTNLAGQNTAASAGEASANVTTNAENVTPPEETATSANATAPENLSENETAVVNETEEEQQASEEANPEEFMNRIWSEGISPPNYFWDPKTFSGFFYDFDNDVGTERLEINLQGSGANVSRAVDSGDLKYRSNVQDIDYEFADWGQYQVIGFMAQKYFAGYRANDVLDKDRSLINEGQLRRVLLDSDSENTITSGSVLPLEEGYELRMKEIDINGNKVYMSLAKDGEEIDSKVISPDGPASSTYVYKTDIGGEDTPLIMAHISNVFASAESDLVTIDGLFQISDTYASVENSDKYGEMEVVSVDENGIEMENEDSLTLRKDKIVNIFGDVGFEVADADILRFAPIVQRTGTFDVRGTVIKPSDFDEFTWTPYNFEGFYYDINDDVGSESLKAEISGGSRIEDKNLLYETKPQPVKFNFENWGKYDVIGFLADKYFAGYNDQTEFTDAVSSISEGQLRKVLIDSDKEETIATGSVLQLDEGYELRIKQVDLNGNKVYLALAKDGEEIDSKVVTPSTQSDSSSSYIYKVDIGGKDVPIIAAHIQSVFRSTETDLATVDGLFQVSDTPESVEEGEVFGKMKVESLGDQGVTMQNDGAITLGRGKNVSIMPNIRFVVADNSERNFAPIAEKTVGGLPLVLNISPAVVDEEIAIVVRSDNKPVSGAIVIVSGNSIGNTDETGSISYTPTKIGSFDVIARKSGYNDAKANLIVRSVAAAAAATASEREANQLIIKAPTEITKGEPFVITVLRGANQTPVEGARVTIDNEVIGNTSAQGTLTYVFNHSSEHVISVDFEGFNTTARKITVNSPIKVQNVTVPEKASAGKDIKITALLQNTGKETEAQNLTLKVNDAVVASKNVSIKPGANSTATFSYKPKDPGVYRISLDGQSKTVNVEESKSNTTLIVLVLILLIAIGAGVYLYKTGELEKIKEKMQKR